MHVTPKLAIVISCYNYEAFVGRAIQSVVSQGRDDCELVVVDDGSTDNSWDVITRSGVTAFRINNGGQRAACLFGLDRTTAPFVLFLDADDELKPGALDTILEYLDPNVSKLQFSLTRIDADGNVISKAPPALEAFRDRSNLARQVLRTGVYRTPPTSGNVFRRDLCELLREADYDTAVDGIVLFAAPFMGDVVSLSEELGRYRIHGRNDSGLGRMPDVATLQRDIHRFVARMDHLRQIILRCNDKLQLIPSQEAYYFRERSFCLAVAFGRRPSISNLVWLLYKLTSTQYPPKSKIAMAIFFVLALLLPTDRARALLAYRFKVGHRSTIGFLKEIVAWR
ncbi:glycosyl transferase [Microvirga sp. KLBC 81]|uniref:glycosyltransferase family 2 protein n=1 Tax=Microvirga sp. KLBC 81 TaxID=1862707 RepID=UPI000D5077D7|nr:glycosyltransferase [Microvirga sp. KLBC 81]PVE21799.1 glycosyl transferase [Microvirga sp. KLBC 81]